MIQLYSPPYSPELNPIEHQWVQVKAFRKLNKCSVEKFFRHLVL
ncbi:MAG: hypothetical protein HC877_15025 [Thioploca sp.]|nr:hypothetical protein [Thioploca sp.]